MMPNAEREAQTRISVAAPVCYSLPLATCNLSPSTNTVPVNSSGPTRTIPVASPCFACHCPSERLMTRAMTPVVTRRRDPPSRSIASIPRFSRQRRVPWDRAMSSRLALRHISRSYLPPPDFFENWLKQVLPLSLSALCALRVTSGGRWIRS